MSLQAFARHRMSADTVFCIQVRFFDSRPQDHGWLFAAVVHFNVLPHICFFNKKAVWSDEIQINGP